MLIGLLAIALGCTPYPVFDGFDADLDGRTLPTDVRIPLRADSITEIRLTNVATGIDEPMPEREWVPDYYGFPPTTLIVPAVELRPDTAYTLWATRGYPYEDVAEDTLAFTTGPGPSAAPGDIELVDIEASSLGDQTNDCTVGTHEPRDLVVTVEVSDAEPLSWIELRNDDLRTWVARRIEGPGTHVLDVFQPVMDTPGTAAVDCFTATLVSPNGTQTESAEFCLDSPEPEPDGCGCSHTSPSSAWLLLTLLGLRSRRSA